MSALESIELIKKKNPAWTEWCHIRLCHLLPLTITDDSEPLCLEKYYIKFVIIFQNLP